MIDIDFEATEKRMKERKNQEEEYVKRIIKIVAIGFCSLLVLMLLFGSYYTIKAGHRGVVLTFGKPSVIASTEGFHLKIPLAQSVVKMDVRTQKYEAGASSASKDLQIVSTSVATNYHISPEAVPRLYKEVGLEYENRIINPAVQEVVKASTAKFTAEELITKRPEVKEMIKQLLKERLIIRDIIVEEISITNFEFSEIFNSAIEAKVEAEQKKLKAERDLERIRIEKEQKIAQAEAQAQSLKLQKREITPDLIRLRQIEAQMLAIEKWNGILPSVTGGAIPLISVDNLAQPTNNYSGDN